MVNATRCTPPARLLTLAPTFLEIVILLIVFLFCPLREYSNPQHMVRTLLLLVASALADQPFADSPALTALWQATSDGSTDAYIAQLIQNREYGSHRSGDGRGPMFWAYEFKNLDARALLMHLEVSPDQEDTEGKAPKEFFPGSAEELAGARCLPFPFRDLPEILRCFLSCGQQFTALLSL